MLVLLSASKKKIGSFITPTATPSSTVSFVDSNAFKYGFYGASINASGSRIDGFIPGWNLTSVKLSYNSSDSFVFSRPIFASTNVSSKDASFIYPPISADASRTISLGYYGASILLPSNNVSVKLSFTRMMLLLTGTNTQNNGFGIGVAPNYRFYNSYTATSNAISMASGSQSVQQSLFLTDFSASTMKTFCAFSGETI